MALTRFELRLFSAVGILYVLQCAVIALMELTFHFPFYEIGMTVSLVWAFVLCLLLWLFRQHFTDLEGHPLTKIGIPNILTLIRLTSLPTMGFLFLLARDHRELTLPLVVFTTIVFLTDLFDGFLARTFHWGSRLGQLMDSSSDYVIIFTLTLIFTFCGVMSLWLVALILVRLLFQAIGMALLSAKFKKHFLDTTFLGKASLFALMVLYAIEILVFLRSGWPPEWAVQILEAATALLMLVSLFDKFLYFRKKFRSG